MPVREGCEHVHTLSCWLITVATSSLSENFKDSSDGSYIDPPISLFLKKKFYVMYQFLFIPPLLRHPVRLVFSSLPLHLCRKLTYRYDFYHRTLIRYHNLTMPRRGLR